MDRDEEEDIARAIALSLEEATRTRDVIEIHDTSEDEGDVQFQTELQQALAVSEALPNHEDDSKPPEPETHSSATAHPNFLLERAKMEKERLERLKRLRPQSTNDTGCQDDDDDDDDDDEGLSQPPAKRQHLSSCGVRVRNDSTSSSSRRGTEAVQTVPTNVPTIDQKFWGGEIRQTATQHAEPRMDGRPTFRLTEILGKKSELSFAIISSYSLDLSWIYEFFDRSVPVILVTQPDPSGEASLKNVLPHWIRTSPYLPAGRGCMHMKFMLLFYKTGRLRVVVSTANLIAYDYRDMENTVWLQDIPLRAKPIPHDPRSPQDFPTVLQGVLRSVHVQPALKTMHPDLPIKTIEELRMRWDWANVKVHLIPSIAGKHEGWPDVIKTGHPRIMQVVRNMGLRTGNGKTSKEIVLECQGSSIGVYTTQWFNEFHWSARGEPAEDWLDEPRKRREKLPYPPIKVVFPTKATVQKTALGEKGGGTIFCRRKQWAAKNFPRSHFYDSKSKGGPVLMHSKMIVAMPRELSKGKQGPGSVTEEESDDEIQVIETAVGWAYIGSHNFTPSAWGTLSGSGFNPILNISNYELGIIFPLKDIEHADSVACFQTAPVKYTQTDLPWMQEESIYHQDV
ncbi:hypothetical protein H0H92_008813 [Tricholoma furcatifolium]|nr:hypothetical protein H0H92_008813 [Tricholoma furcatifolium]